MRPSEFQNGHRYRVVLEDTASGPNHLIYNTISETQPTVVSIEEIPPEGPGEPDDSELIKVDSPTGSFQYWWKDVSPSDGRKGWTNGSKTYLNWDGFLTFVSILGGTWRVFNVTEST